MPAIPRLLYWPAAAASHSYDGSLDYGLIACRRAVPDLADLADFVVDEHRRLSEAAMEAPAVVEDAKTFEVAAPLPVVKRKRVVPTKSVVAKKTVVAKKVRNNGHEERDCGPQAAKLVQCIALIDCDT